MNKHVNPLFLLHFCGINTLLWYKLWSFQQSYPVTVLLPYVYETFQNVKPALQSHIAENI